MYSKLLWQSPLDLPKLESISLQISLKDQAFNTRRFFLPAYLALELITGQKPRLIEAKESVATLSIREGDFGALSLKLRKGQMFQFLDSLVNIVLPSMGSMDNLLETSFDNQGNYSMKIPNLLFFPQLEKEYNHFHPMSSASPGEREGDLLTYLPVQINFCLRLPKGLKNTSAEASKVFIKSLHLPFSS
jgi:ribosomal protein L5